MLRALVLLALIGVACSGGDDATSTSVVGSVPAVSPTTVTSPATESSSITAVICDDSPNRMAAEAEALTAESWQCTSGGEHARVDVYESDEQISKAQQAVSDVYEQSGDQRGLDQLPFVCGERFTVGLDSNEQRDVVIHNLETAGITASTC